MDGHWEPLEADLAEVLPVCIRNLGSLEPGSPASADGHSWKNATHDYTHRPVSAIITTTRRQIGAPHCVRYCANGSETANG